MIVGAREGRPTPSPPRRAARGARGGRLLLIGALFVVFAASCEGQVSSSPPAVELRAPPRAGFESVADAMQPSCGTLDCHGQRDRNLRLFGERGLRLDPADTSAEGATKPAEYEATFWAVTALESELLSAVVHDGGALPERLILIRKARETTRHKGGKLMVPGDNLDQCLIEWLKGTIAVDACMISAKLGPPVVP